jgi:hypothetical protein
LTVENDRIDAAERGTAKSKRRLLAGVIFFVVLGALIVLFFSMRHNNNSTSVKPATVSKQDTTAHVKVDTGSAPKDTPAVAPEVRKTAPRSPVVAKIVTTIVPSVNVHADTARDTARSDTGRAESDAAFLDRDSLGCKADTGELWVYPEPSGGQHRGPVLVALHGNRICTISWRIEPDTAWREFADTQIDIGKTGTLDFKAVDRCGRVMEPRQEYYEIAPVQTSVECPEAMEFVKIGNTQFCIDRYEWPNRKGAIPVSFVTLYQAMDSCYGAGKRLCTAEEWSLACSGPFSWKYPYGQRYEHNACVTADTIVRPSGSKPECRAYYGAFDMAGNLLEWTSTPAKANPQFNEVMGGFWESGSHSGCFDIRYSYFPQNRHNPVGFRCCKDASMRSSGN